MPLATQLAQRNQMIQQRLLKALIMLSLLSGRRYSETPAFFFHELPVCPMRIKAATLVIFPANLHTKALMYFEEQCGQAYERLRQNILSTFGLLDQIAMVAEIAQPMGGHSLLPQAPKYCILVDTSDKDWGRAFQHRVAQGLWTADGRFQSINWRELKVIELILLAFPLLHDILF